MKTTIYNSDYKLQPFEKETIILFNETNEPASIETWDSKWLSDLQKSKHSICLHSETDKEGNILWQKYSLPKNRLARLITERMNSPEQTQINIDRMKEINGKKNV